MKFVNFITYIPDPQKAQSVPPLHRDYAQGLAADRSVVCDLHRGLDCRNLDRLGTVLKTRPVKITKKDPSLHVRTSPFLVVLPARCDAELDGEGRKHR